MSTRFSWRFAGFLLCNVLSLLTHRAAAQAPAVLRGRVETIFADSVSVSWRPEALDNREMTVRAALSAQGDFELPVPVPRATLAELRCGSAETSIFLEPDNVLQVRFEEDNLGKTIKFKSGDGAGSRPAANANNYLSECNRQIFDIEGFQVLPENISLYEDAFISYLNYRRKEQQKLLRAAGGPEAFSPAFSAFALAEIKYLHANDRLTYPELREQVVGHQGRIVISPGYYKFLDEQDMVPGAEDAPASPQCQEFMLNYIHYRMRTGGLPLTSPGYYPACYELAASTFRGALRPLVMGRILLETFRFGHLKHATGLLNDYAAQGHAPTSWVALLRRDLEAHRALAIGAPAPPLPLRTPAGDSLRLAVYHGKLVYVMFWDSRLPQSQRELPYLKELLKKLDGQPIVFVSADFDEAHTEALADTSRLLQNAVVPAEERRIVRKRFDIGTLPSFVLLAEDGTVLDPNPKRLSSRALLDDLNAAFGKAAAYRAVPLPKPPPEEEE